MSQPFISRTSKRQAAIEPLPDGYIARIKVVRRFTDWMAHYDGNHGVWGCGKSPAEAIGDLVKTHADHFALVVEVER